MRATRFTVYPFLSFLHLWSRGTEERPAHISATRSHFQILSYLITVGLWLVYLFFTIKIIASGLRFESSSAQCVD